MATETKLQAGKEIKFQIPYFNSFFVGYGKVINDEGSYVNIEVLHGGGMEKGTVTDITKRFIIEEK